jgi:hypothetical protein
VNSQLIRDFVAAPVPCCSLGLVKEGNRSYAFLALRPHVPIPSGITAAGFNFGHALLGTSEFEVIQFAFEFYGFETYHVLLNPSNSVVQTVVNSMMEDGEYFIFAVDSDEGVTTFRADVGRSALAGLRDNLQRIRHSTTNEAQYERALAQFRHHPSPPGPILNWVCRDSFDSVNPGDDPLEMTPAH